ncbi:hypothetical protein K1719_024611 [Acacia pycnantha]|nr:hypothetical protein K1719_024611 [Acacia pycnantha]
MKNVAKCDTWRELQNPVNHRVFERKLRPKPPCRGYARPGVTQGRQRPILRRGRMMASRSLALRLAEKGPNVATATIHSSGWRTPARPDGRASPHRDLGPFGKSLLTLARRTRFCAFAGLTRLV